MRVELAPYSLNMSSVKMRVRVIDYRHYRMDGISNLTVRDPLTQLIIPMLFADPGHREGLENWKFGNSKTQTVVKPLMVNDEPIRNIDHMIICCDMALPRGAVCDIYGYISAYVRQDGTVDYCICS